ncbi:type VII secretion protein EssC [Enterococcus sp. MMGLQ5-2]|nr:type VII secretion protein EssC [Enterococcus sp. MMGLQ5-2]MBS7583646.1 type VII secretion protein EssC [Enterococcus sp. MMGLQ5-1]
MNKVDSTSNFFIDERLNPNQLEFVVYVLNDSLIKITLTSEVPFANYLDYKFGIINDKLFINGESVSTGLYNLDDLRLLIISKSTAQTLFFTIDSAQDFVIGQADYVGIQVPIDLTIIIHQNKLILDAKDTFIYLNENKIQGQAVTEFITGTAILTEQFLLEKRMNQWKITFFSADYHLSMSQLLLELQKREFPKDFPDYRRSPRLNLEVPTDKLKLQVIAKESSKSKNSLLKMIAPPLGMVVMTGLTTFLSGRNPIMMMGMGAMSLLTASFTVSQYFTEKKDLKIENERLKADYAYYLVNTVNEISKAYETERAVLDFQQPAPERLVDLVLHYDSRIYERQTFNKDFLNISLGESDQPSNLKIDNDINPKDLSADAKRIQELTNHFSTQRTVATPINLYDQSLGLVGQQETLTGFVETLLFQTAFFHSYRDVNFIHLLPKDTYYEFWYKWRLLPHFKLQELNMRGLIYSDKLRDVVLNSFYQLLNKRKQVLNESGKEKPEFSPHYILTIFDDSMLAGHGINELLAENMNDLGVTVIWCKESVNQLPETVTSVIEVPNKLTAKLVTDHDVYLAKQFKPYPVPETLERALRTLSNLNHLEVEKNAIPESLSLLEQYDVKTIELLEIKERWTKAEPNKSIRSLIGWRGKSDYVYWDLHERAHGPHALVGGTTGSGKSEFLTTYLIGLAINFSPEDVGMLIIDWKGGGIANTLDKLPHFMGAITNLDGAGTARALASIKAELDKRQREFAKHGVNNINGYMSLYKQRNNPKPDISYPTQPLPHLVLVSDEFAELKANVPEFLDELTSVARIGRSLGVHLILATQKPSGVVNDQIEANSTSKIALKMASTQDSNELLKTPDAAHITNPGRGYLKVGQNEVYELFQSGYAGVPYDPEALAEEKIDERLFKINDLGQYELLYDPGEEVIQGKDTSDLPTQLEAVISEIEQIFADSALVHPEKPWLPNLPELLPTPKVTLSKQRDLSVPLGLLDEPREQRQSVYHYDIEKAGHTAIFASPGYGKSTVLQTLVLNLSQKNSPEQVQFNLLDFGNNGLLPLKDLPNVIDIVTLEEDEKLQKMIERLANILAARKKDFKLAGVASLSQYEFKTKKQLPIIISVIDNYDGLTQNDNRKDKIDNLLIQLLREGASLGVYLILTASRTGAVRMNMLSNIASKLALFLNDESEVATLMGRERVLQEAINGRGQVLLELPTAIQFYLPAAGEDASEILENLEKEVAALDEAWHGLRPEKIPMVPEELYLSDFLQYESVKSMESSNGLPFGLSLKTTEALGFLPGMQPYFVFSSKEDEQQLLFQQMLIRQGGASKHEFLLADFDGSFDETLDSLALPNNFTKISDKNDAKEIVTGIVGYLNLSKRKEKGTPMTLVIGNLTDFVVQTGIKAEDFVLALKHASKSGLDFIIFTPHDYLAKSFDSVPKLLREMKFTGIIGARAYDSPLIKVLGYSQEPEPALDEPYFVMRGGSTYSQLKLPRIDERTV